MPVRVIAITAPGGSVGPRSFAHLAKTFASRVARGGASRTVGAVHAAAPVRGGRTAPS